MSLPRLRAPQDDGQYLIVPEPQQVGPAIESNRTQLASRTPIFGRPLAQFRKQAIAEILAAARAEHRACGEPLPDRVSDSLFLVGHQPELFHPGVWLKNFAVHDLADQFGACALNLIVDSDIAKSPAIAVPVWNANPAKVHRVSVAFDAMGAAVPIEERTVQDKTPFVEFATAVRSHTSSWTMKPILDQFWAEVLRQRERTTNVGEMLAGARRAFERRWGAHNWEIRLSSVCRTAAFGEFAMGILRSLPAFHDAYNLAVRSYRQRHRIRNPQHPVPDLARHDDWLEAPFWAWRADQPRRERLFVRQAGGRFELRAGGQSWPDLSPHADSDAWSKLEHSGFKVRTRALTTTLFARLLIGDLFVHGIGGGKYDELTDELLQRFFGIQPPAFVVLTGTLLLPLPLFPGTDAELRAARRAVRDLDWNPQRYLPAEVLSTRHETLTALRPDTRRERAKQFAEFRKLNEQLRPKVAQCRDVAIHRREQLQAEVTANEILQARDYSFVLHSESRLKEFLCGNVGKR